MPSEKESSVNLNEASKLAAECAPPSIVANGYSQALMLLYDRIDYERIGHAPYTSNHYRLDRMRQLLCLLESPQNDYPILHIAGTKGKGTTASLVCSGLLACGLRTVLFTSPHLLKLEERIQFQGSPCSETELVALTETVLQAAAVLEARGDGRPTFFELTTAMGMLHASQQAADCLVLEVGLGGRLDSTNVCEPVLTIITSISLDHQAQLGDTIAEIAGEKAGIIKRGVPVICTARHPDARAVIEAVASRQQAPLQMIDRDFFVQWRPLPRPSRNNMPMHLERPVTPLAPLANDFQGNLPSPATGTPHAEIFFHRTQPATTELTTTTNVAQAEATQPTRWSTRMLGRHQADNFAGVLAALDTLRGLGWELPHAQVNRALADCVPLARLQILNESPLEIIDTAHNPASIEAALDAIDEHFPEVPRVIVFASSRDKDFRRMLELLLPRCDHLVLTAYQNNPRALPVTELLAATEEQRHKLLADSHDNQSLLQTPSVADDESRIDLPASSAARELCQVHHAATPAAALRLAESLAPATPGQEQLIMATGSFFLAAELLPCFDTPSGEQPLAG